MATTVLTPAVPTSANRRAPWRSPDDQPGYARPALLVIVASAVLLYAWGINHSQYHLFYANAVRSMTESWKAFLFGSFDPGNAITLDKLPGFLWPQAISARLFGFHPWALTLPQAVEGVASILVLYRVVRRWAGVNAALIAGAAFLSTPVAAGLFRTSVEDPAFTLCVLLAAAATQRAAEAGRLRPLLLAGVWVGLGFQAKMLEAWAVLPALAIVYLVSAPVPLRRRLGRLALAGLVTLAVSLSWMLAVTLTPAKDRPYVDGTTNNSAFSMVVGYNFLNRFSSLGISAASTGSVSAIRGGGGASGGGANGGGATHHQRGSTGAGGGWGGGHQDGWSKMFGSSLASQTGWFYPFAAITVGCGLLWRRGRPRTDPVRAGYLFWGVWLTTFFLVFSAGSVGGHTYYMGVIATPLAALFGAGVTLLWREYRAGGPRAWALPLSVAATVAWGAWISEHFPSFLPWLAPTAVALGVPAVALLVLARPGGPATTRARMARAGLLAGLAAVLIVPGAWAAQVFNPAYGRTGMMGSVGPTTSTRLAAGRSPDVPWPGRAYAAFGGSGSGALSGPQRKLLAYTRAHRGKAEYVFATTSWSSASPFILASGADVLPLGGFTGQVPFPTLAQFQQLVRSGRLHYVVQGRPGGFGGFGRTTASGGTTARITTWVTSTCGVVPGTATETLYDCTTR